MANPNFIPTMSSNEVWRDLDDTRCLTDDLDAIEADISALETDKADADHSHSDYASTSHEHSDYALSTHTHNYEDLNGKPTIPTIPDSLPANGGNADTVDGKHASEFVQAYPTPVTTAGEDLDNYTTQGIYVFPASCTPTNVPTGSSNGWLIVLPWTQDSTTIKQIWLRHGTPGSTDHEVWVRMKTSSVGWGNWAKFYTSKNPPTAEDIGFNDLTTGSITQASGVGSMDIVVKYNDYKALVYGSFTLSSDLAGGATATIGTNLPSAIRPVSSTETAITFYGTRPLVIRLTSDGALEMRNASDTTLYANSNIGFRISYPLF